jgi:hypothetical protein
MKRLTKEDILEGTRRRDNIFVKEYGREVVIRPLSDEEITIILSKTSISIAGENPPPPPATGNSIDLEKNFEALRLAVSMGMVEPKLTSEEVAKMKFGVPEYIGSYILQISGVSSPEITKKKGRK